MPEGVAEHLEVCMACREVAEQIERIEADWRAMPLPPSLRTPKHYDLNRAVASPADRAPPVRPLWAKARGSKLVRWAIAAAAVLAIGVGVYLALPRSLLDPKARTAPDLFDRLLDWNVALAEVPEFDRERIYLASVDQLRTEAASPAVSPDEAEFAKTLLDNADWLTKHADQIAATERLSAVADKLLMRIQHTAKYGKQTKLRNFTRHYARVDRVIQATLEQAKVNDSPSSEVRHRLSALVEGDQHRHDALKLLLASVSKSEQTVIRGALEAGNRANAHKAKKPE